VVNTDAGGSCEIPQVHVIMERDWGALDIGQRSGIEECDECIGQFLQQQQAEEAQHPSCWPF
jgi:hypothetical protein